MGSSIIHLSDYLVTGFLKAEQLLALWSPHQVWKPGNWGIISYFVFFLPPWGPCQPGARVQMGSGARHTHSPGTAALPRPPHH